MSNFNNQRKLLIISQRCVSQIITKAGVTSTELHHNCYELRPQSSILALMNASLWITLSVVWRLIRSYNLQFHCMWNGHFVLTADITVSRDNLAKSFLISFNTRRHSWQLQVLRAVARVQGTALHQGKSHLISKSFCKRWANLLSTDAHSCCRAFPGRSTMDNYL